MSLRRDYVISSTLLRLVLPLYVWGCPSNVLSIEATGESSTLPIARVFAGLTNSQAGQSSSSSTLWRR